VDLDPHADDYQNLISSSLTKIQVKFSWRSVQ